MSSLRHRVKQVALIYVGAVLLTVMYLLPTFPKSVGGWLWLLVLSAPYVALLGLAASLMRRSIPIRNWINIASIVGALAVMSVATYAYMRLSGVFV